MLVSCFSCSYLKEKVFVKVQLKRLAALMSLIVLVSWSSLIVFVHSINVECLLHTRVLGMSPLHNVSKPASWNEGDAKADDTLIRPGLEL